MLGLGYEATVQDHAEQSADAAPIGFHQEVGNLRQDRPGSYQSARKAAGELHCPRVIRVACVEQGEKRTGVSENVSRR